jgi:hypothetical protein
VREKYCWLAENKRLKAQANRLGMGLFEIRALIWWMKATFCPPIISDKNLTNLTKVW